MSVKALYILAGLVFIVMASVTACSNEQPITPTTESLPQHTASEAIELSRLAMSNVKSFRFQFTHAIGQTIIALGLELTKAGGLVAPNGINIEAEANLGRAFVKIEAAVIDEEAWMTNPLTGAWSEIAPENSPFSFIDPVKMVSDILAETEQAEYVKYTSSNKELLIKGSLPASSLENLVGSVDRYSKPLVYLNIDAETMLLKRVEIRGMVQPEDDPDTVRIITFSDFNKPVSIKRPT